MSTRSLHRGFTLIELLVVIAIIAILAAILFPVFAKAREKAMQTTCANNQRQIAISIQMYAQDHDQTLPEAATIWQTLELTPKIVKCPTDSRSKSGYIYSISVAGRSMGDFTDPTTVLMTADGQHSATNDTSAPAFQPTKENVGYSDNDLRKRHGNKYIGSYLDGHVALTNESPTWVIPVPGGGMTSDLLANLNSGALVDGKQGWTRNPSTESADCTIIYQPSPKNSILMGGLTSVTGLGIRVTRELPGFSSATSWTVAGTFEEFTNPPTFGSESNPDDVLRLLGADGSEIAYIGYWVNNPCTTGNLKVNDKVVAKNPVDAGWQQYKKAFTMSYANGAVTTTIDGVSSTKSCVTTPAQLVGSIRSNIGSGLTLELSNLTYEVE